MTLPSLVPFLILTLIPAAAAGDCAQHSFPMTECGPRPTEDQVSFYKSIATRDWKILISESDDFVVVLNTDRSNADHYIFFTNKSHDAHPSYVEITRFHELPEGETHIIGFTAKDCRDFEAWKSDIEQSWKSLVGKNSHGGT